ncbi:MAG: DUF3258 domain-containing protein [bacterium]|nr:DUF3258 domain-containing protein [bacterium]
MVQQLVQSRHPYVILRGRTYYFRYAFPKHLRDLCPWLPAEVKRTLRTSSFSDAVAFVTQKQSLINVLKCCRDASLVKGLYERLQDFSGDMQGWVGSQYKALIGQEGCSGNTVIASTPKSSYGPKLSRVWNDFIKWKNWTAKRTSTNELLFNNLMFFLGDKSITHITKADVKKALGSISKLPVRNKRPYSRMALKDIVKRDIPEEDRISSKSVREHLKLMQGMFSSYLVKEVELLDRSPTEGVRWEVENNRYGNMTDVQVRHVLKRSVNKPEWFRWFLKIAVYSGARRSEIAALEATDFRYCEDTQRHYFLIRKGKTPAARRFVPVHRELIQAGLIAWIGKQEGMLFPIAANTPNRVTENFAGLLDEHVNGMGERIVFHSVRHTFITKARAATPNTALIQQVVGHEKTGAGMTDRYTHSFQMKDVLPVVDKVDYRSSGSSVL